jgi:hypothetical protein
VNLEDESSLTEISILPDGRVYLFGASRQVLEVLNAVPLGDPTLAERVRILRETEGPSSLSESLKTTGDSVERVDECRGGRCHE